MLQARFLSLCTAVGIASNIEDAFRSTVSSRGPPCVTRVIYYHLRRTGVTELNANSIAEPFSSFAATLSPAEHFPLPPVALSGAELCAAAILSRPRLTSPVRHWRCSGTAHVVTSHSQGLCAISPELPCLHSALPRPLLPPCIRASFVGDAGKISRVLQSCSPQFTRQTGDRVFSGSFARYSDSTVYCRTGRPERVSGWGCNSDVFILNERCAMPVVRPQPTRKTDTSELLDRCRQNNGNRRLIRVPALRLYTLQISLDAALTTGAERAISRGDFIVNFT